MNLTPEDAQRLAGVLLDEDLGDATPAESRLPPGPFSRYRITRLVGVGGMGEVYEAQQDNPDRRVAIKVIRPDRVSPELLRRFEHETRILARLQHPGIAPIYEAGQAPTAGGPMPFFAMEFVDGRPLTAHATNSNLPLRSRLELFLLVCDAVEHAHRKGIIHRDLKPANILIDARGQPRILDFGIARATDSDIRTTTLHTEVGKLIGTLPYMSPEQAGGDPDELDTRSDVYSLGVILYELLSGRPPYDFLSPGHRLVPQALRAILETEPAPLSSINRVFRGDLETIVGKALAKERERRYQSVGELAADVRRFLSDEPIEARAPGSWYQLVKFARRHRGLMAGLSIGAAALALGASGAVWQAIVATHARNDAIAAHATERDLLAISRERETEAAHSAEVARAVRAFLEEILTSPDPAKKGRDVRVMDILDRGAAALPKQFADQPEVRAELEATVGETYRTLGQLDKAEQHHRNALTLFEQVGEANGPRASRAKNDLAVVLVARGNLLEAEPLYAAAINGQRAAGDDKEALTALSNLAGVLADKGRSADAIQLYEQAAAGFSRLLGPDAPKTLGVRSNIAVAMMESQRFREAEPVLREVLQARERTVGTDAPETLRVLGNLTACLKEQGKLDEAEPIARQCLELTKSRFGQDHPETVGSLNTLASILEDGNRLTDAEAMYREALETAQRVYPPTHWILGLLRSNYGRCLRLQERYAEAEPLLLQGLEELQTALGPDHQRSRLAELAVRALYKGWNKPEMMNKYRSFVPPGATAEPNEPTADK